MSLTNLNAYQRGGPVLDKLRSLWEGIRGRADDPSLGYVGASMLPGIGEATDLVEIGAGLQDRSPGRIGLGLAGLALPFVGAAGLKKIGKKSPLRSHVRPKVERPGTRDRRIALDLIDKTKAHNDAGEELLAYWRRMPHAAAELSAANRLAPRPEDLHPSQIRDILKLPRAERMRALGYDLDVYHGTRKSITEPYLKVGGGAGAVTSNPTVRGRGALGRGVYSHEEPAVATYFSSKGMREYMRATDHLRELKRTGRAVPSQLKMLEAYETFKMPWLMKQATGSNIYPLKARSSRLLTVPYRVTPAGIIKQISQEKRFPHARGHGGPDEMILRRAMPTPFHEILMEADRRGLYVEDAWNKNLAGPSEIPGLGEIAQELGYEGLRVHPRGGGWAWNDPSAHEILTFEPGAGLRSKFARFDPRKLHSRDLLAGIGGLAGARYMSNALREDREN